MQKICCAEKLTRFNEHWSPRVVGELNGQHVKLVKLLGEFDWHHHPGEDELFFVLHGSFRMDYRDDAGQEHALDLSEGELVIVPRGVEHRPCAASECHVMLFEPAGTLNTGNVRTSKTIDRPATL